MQLLISHNFQDGYQNDWLKKEYIKTFNVKLNSVYQINLLISFSQEIRKLRRIFYSVSKLALKLY